MASRGDETVEGSDASLTCPNGLFNFPLGTTQVEDADEEVMELYMSLASTSNRDEPEAGGLGFLDSTKAVLEIELDLSPKAAMASSQSFKPSGRGRKTAARSPKASGDSGALVSVKVQQDLGALKSRKGDTGSVLWRSSYHLAHNILAQQQHPPDSPHLPLMDPTNLRKARILELGAGTGLLAILLSRLCNQYTVSDQLENLKLVERNLALNGIDVDPGPSPAEAKDIQTRAGHKLVHDQTRKSDQPGVVRLEEVDWNAVSQNRQRQQVRQRPNFQVPAISLAGGDVYDLVLAVDCIYNESLVQPLVDTLAHYCPRGGRTVAWVVVELRSADVLTLFLDTWLADSDGAWTVVRIPSEAMGDWGGHKARWAGWVGWRS